MNKSIFSIRYMLTIKLEANRSVTAFGDLKSLYAIDISGSTREYPGEHPDLAVKQLEFARQIGNPSSPTLLWSRDCLGPFRLDTIPDLTTLYASRADTKPVTLKSAQSHLESADCLVMMTDGVIEPSDMREFASLVSTLNFKAAICVIVGSTSEDISVFAPLVFVPNFMIVNAEAPAKVLAGNGCFENFVGQTFDHTTLTSTPLTIEYYKDVPPHYIHLDNGVFANVPEMLARGAPFPDTLTLPQWDKLTKAAMSFNLFMQLQQRIMDWDTHTPEFDLIRSIISDHAMPPEDDGLPPGSTQTLRPQLSTIASLATPSRTLRAVPTTVCKRK